MKIENVVVVGNLFSLLPSSVSQYTMYTKFYQVFTVTFKKAFSFNGVAALANGLQVAEFIVSRG